MNRRVDDMVYYLPLKREKKEVLSSGNLRILMDPLVRMVMDIVVGERGTKNLDGAKAASITKTC